MSKLFPYHFFVGVSKVYFINPLLISYESGTTAL